MLLCVLHFLYDGLEGSGVVHCQVGKHFAVDFDACFVDETHELGVGEVFEASCGVDTLNPEGAEVALFVLAVAVSVGETLFPSVLGYSPNVATASEVTTGKFEDFLAASS